MTGGIVIPPAELAKARAILKGHLPQDVKVWVFGSRAGGNPKPWSDLDIALEGRVALPLSLMAELAEAFDESALPWKVDLLDYSTVTPQFRAIIDRGKLPLF